MRCPRGVRRLFRSVPFLFCLLLSSVTLCIVYSYCTLAHLNEFTSSAIPLVVESAPEETTTRKPDTEECSPRDAELVDFPNCRAKWAWMREGWKTHSCYAKMGVNGTGCSFRRFLSMVERHCPLLPGTSIPEVERTIAQPNFSMDELFAKMVDKPVNFEFIKKRITRMWESWKEAYRENVRAQPETMKKLQQQTIILHLGFLTNTKFGELSSKGGPLGELVQWSDLIAALHILGHDVRISTQPESVLKTMDSFGSVSPCPDGRRVDLIFTDIMGLRLMQRKRRQFMAVHKCKLRLLDSFGTHAQFNTREYFNAHKAELGAKNPWGGHGLALRQFLSLYPHTHDNTFLGFVVNAPHESEMRNVTKGGRSGVLVYGKEKYMWAKAEEAVKTAMQITEVHATVADAADASALPPGVINHGLLGEEQFHSLLSKVKIFLGLGFPFEGPAPLEAVAHGAIFINPRFSPPKGRLTDKFFAEKPTLRALTSQCPYLEEMGEPWVMTVDTADKEALTDAIKRAVKAEVTPRTPFELTAPGMLLRVAVVVDRLDTCEALPRWPPPSALRAVVGKAGWSCEAACGAAGLRCDSALFPLVNRKERLMGRRAKKGEERARAGEEEEEEKEEMHCESIAIAPSIVAPSRCTLQENPLLFSCSASLNGTVRLCPCRDFLPDQHELCSQCL